MKADIDWREMADTLEKIFKGKCYAYNPGFAICQPEYIGSFELPFWAAEVLIAQYHERKNSR